MANEFCFRTMVAKINKKTNNFIWSDAILQYGNVILKLSQSEDSMVQILKH